jgi:hypothetical protein
VIDDEDGVPIDHERIIEEANTPNAECQTACGERTEYIVEFRDLVNDVTRTRSLCRTHAEQILEAI